MKLSARLAILTVLVAFVTGPLVGCGVQSIPQAENAVEAAVAEVTNQYKRRADLIPNLVQTVKGYASHEQETLSAVISALSGAGRRASRAGTRSGVVLVSSSSSAAPPGLKLAGAGTPDSPTLA